MLFLCRDLSRQSKTTRTIQRLVGGHLHHSVYRKTNEDNVSPNRLSKLYFRRKEAAAASGSEGLLEASAGDGKDEANSSKKDESKKTLSDQVAEGKYGLIQNELFQKTPKRPGIISYLPNPEVPNDTADNLGGLNADDIWLAEDHLLVLKGGSVSNRNREEPWKPIDNYEAPLRQVKIPDNPKVPPPFPVQLGEGEPIQIIGNNQFPLINPFTNESLLLFPDGGFPKTETYSGDKTNIFTRPGSPNDTKVINGDGGYFYAPPPPPGFFGSNGTLTNPFLNGPPPFGGPFGPGPFGNGPPPPYFPNGSLENSNFTDLIDEDDPSFFYPPPYSFVYKRNYTNLVEPGPLVPGIILPPPPNFFSRLNNKTTTAPSYTTPSTSTSRPNKQILRPVYRYGSTSTTTTTETYRQNVLAPTKIPLPSTTQKSITQLKKVSGSDVLSFVPRDAISSDPLQSNKGNPIYYEYFDARVKTNPRPPVYSSTTTLAPTSASTEPAAVPPAYSRTQLRPAPNPIPRRPYNAYLPVQEVFDYNKYLYITPKPEIKPNGIATNFVPLDDAPMPTIDSRKPAVQPVFNSEVQNIRQTIQFYKQQQGSTTPQTLSTPTPTKYTTQLPRIPKAKAIYEFSFDSSAGNGNSKLFHPPTEFDSTPFKPMVQYSPPLHSNNGFQAIPAVTQSPAPNYYSTIGQIYPSAGAHGHNNFGNKPTAIPLTVQQQQQQTPWVQVEKQVFRELHPKDINVQIQTHSPRPFYRAPYESYVDANNGYYYRQPVVPVRQNPYYYPYNQAPSVPLHKDILVNYKYPLPTINPDSEFLPQVQYRNYRRLPVNAPTVIQYKLPGDQQAGVYFYTPQEEKYSTIKK